MGDGSLNTCPCPPSTSGNSTWYTQVVGNWTSSGLGSGPGEELSQMQRANVSSATGGGETCHWSRGRRKQILLLLDETPALSAEALVGCWHCMISLLEKTFQPSLSQPASLALPRTPEAWAACYWWTHSMTWTDRSQQRGLSYLKKTDWAAMCGGRFKEVEQNLKNKTKQKLKMF